MTNTRNVRQDQRAFTLVELSIVLVILGLLVGGVLAGQSLIQSAQLRTIGTQMTGYTTALHAFREKYLGLPGDITNASAFWGKDNGVCPGDTGSAATPGTCSGNGDGIIGDRDFTSGPQFYESYRAWQQLANAGLVEGQYSGVSGGGSSFHSVPGVNVPTGKYPGSAFDFIGAVGFGTATYPAFFYPMKATTVMEFGKAMPNDLAEGEVITQTDAYNIDTKLDDGRPGTGIYTVWRPSSAALEPAIGNADCATDNDSALAQYKTTMNTNGCSLLIQIK